MAFDALRAKVEEFRRKGQTVVFAAIDGQPAGLIGIADPIKESAQAIADLKADGMRIVMLTGDSRATAEAVARKLGIRTRGRSVASEKAKVIEKLQKAGRIVAMAGDGVNDAPALAQAASASRWGREPMSPWKVAA